MNSHPWSVQLNGCFNFFIDEEEDHAITQKLLKPGGNQLKVVGYQK
jgi:hypothetical protein